MLLPTVGAFAVGVDLLLVVMVADQVEIQFVGLAELHRHTGLDTVAVGICVFVAQEHLVRVPVLVLLNRCTHTDSYTFSKSNYTKARDYAPSKRYAAAKKSVAPEEKETANKGRNNKKEQPQVTASTRKSTKESREKSRSTYKVQKGDNLGKIASRNGTTGEQLKKLNGLTSNTIEEGKVLKVK